MGDDHGAAGELDQRLFERAQRLDVEIVGRLVEQDHVGAGLQHLGEMDAVAFAARELADLLLLIGALEVELGDKGAARHLALAELDFVLASGNFLPDGSCRARAVARLIDIAELDRIADDESARIGLFLAGDHAEQRRFAGAVGADDADDAAGRQVEGKIVDQEPVAIAFAEMLGLDHQIAEPRPGRNDDLRGAVLARFSDCATRFSKAVMRALLLAWRARGLERTHSSSSLEGALAGRFFAFLLLEALLLLLEPRGVIALVRNALAAVELEDPAGDVVEEVAVMGDDHHGARVFAQMLFEPGHGFGVEMVGRLVEQQQIGLGQQQPAERHAAPLAARQLVDPGVAGRAAQRVHGDLDLARQFPGAEMVDLFLQFGLLGDQLVHLVFGKFFARTWPTPPRTGRAAPWCRRRRA